MRPAARFRCATATTPPTGAPPVAKRRKQRLNALGAASLAAEVALVGVNAALGQQNFRRPPARRLLRRR